ncbi:hypothetical protein Back2_11170 [Nocardioides baekrokdamisoli]|uniref:DUF4245 domain-containing protein n=1 Tax=Nocardioides baekrokdamisoli TaxID=1804624 RepID=A0A3G9ICY4_9ACTN|nr:DUF4245 family protein [Nocardioides baekrokdamisoli]BBH16830.1 hypothetical protein Back2_11170 [Nocardioides baekrokdamisoli]
MSDQEPTSVQPGMVGARRYPRTFNGLIGSLVVLVVAVGGCAVLQNVNHSTVSNAACSAVPDWQTTLTQAQGAGVLLDYPGSLPAGWMVTNAAWDNDAVNGQPRWRIGTHNSDCSQFAGLIEEQAPARTLISAVVGSGEVTRTLAGTGRMTIVAHATSQAALDQFVASLTRAKLKG